MLPNNGNKSNNNDAETNVKFSKTLINNNNNNKNDDNTNKSIKNNDLKTEISDSMDVDQAAALLASLKHKLPSQFGSKQESESQGGKRTREPNDDIVLSTMALPALKKRRIEANAGM